MTGLTVTGGDGKLEPATGWQLEWLDRGRGIARLSDGTQSLRVIVEGRGTDWFVTLRGRRVAVKVESWRERTMAAARAAEVGEGGPVEIRATLPGLVVAIKVGAGDKVASGDGLLTIEAMKMQNEVRAPRDGTVAEIAVEAGQPVAAGVLLLRLD